MRVYVSVASLLAVLAGCTVPPNPADLVSSYQSMSAASLWALQADSPSALALAFIETELAGRGETAFGGSYLGQRSASAYGKAVYSRSPDVGGLNCNDFSSEIAAQRQFLASGGPLNDPNNLDADGDGLACEWGVTLTAIANANRATATAAIASDYRTASRCYRGPRGGTYTITSGGAKDYDGC